MLKNALLLMALCLSMCVGVRAQSDCKPVVKPVKPSSSTSADAVQWVRYTTSCEDFSIEMPGEPFVHETVRAVRGMPYEVTEPKRVYGKYGDGQIYMLIAYDNPHDWEGLDFFLQLAQQELPGLREMQEESAALRKLGGRQYAFSGGSRTGIARLYLVPKHVYVLAVFGEQISAETKRYFDSFALNVRPATWKTTPPMPPAPVASHRPPEPPPILVANPNAPKVKSPSLPTPQTVTIDPSLFPPGRRNAPAGDPKTNSSSNVPPIGVGPGVGSERRLGAGRGSNVGGGDPRESPGGGGPGSHAPIDYTRPFTVRDVTRRAVLVYKPEPAYTESARRANVMGVVRLRAVLASDGTVKNISVIKGLPDGLTEQAIYASGHLLFYPAQKDGRIVSQYVTLEYNFNIY